jgi:hypothetical protein
MTAPWTRTSNRCAICNALLMPFDQNTFTAHEFHCYRDAPPAKIPPQDLTEFNRQMLWWHRSQSAKRGAQTRARNRRTQK